MLNLLPNELVQQIANMHHIYIKALLWHMVFLFLHLMSTKDKCGWLTRDSTSGL